MQNVNQTIEEFKKLEKVRESMPNDYVRLKIKEASKHTKIKMLVNAMSNINRLGIDEAESDVAFVENFCLEMPTATIANMVLSLFDSGIRDCSASKEVFRVGIRFGLLGDVTPKIDYVRYAPRDYNKSLDIDFIFQFEGWLRYTNSLFIPSYEAVEYTIDDEINRFNHMTQTNKTSWLEAIVSI